jgi:hypothetical protein
MEMQPILAAYRHGLKLTSASSWPLYQRAVGYSYDAEQIVCDQNGNVQTSEFLRTSRLPR